MPFFQLSALILETFVHMYLGAKTKKLKNTKYKPILLDLEFTRKSKFGWNVLHMQFTIK